MTQASGGWWNSSNLIVLTSVVSAAAVGIVVIVESTLAAPGDTTLVVARWTTYGLFAATLLMIHEWLPRPGFLSPSVLHVFLVAFAALLVLLIPDQVWMLMLFVLSATMSAFVWRPRAVFLLIVAQILLIVGVAVVNGWPVMEFVLAVAGFGSIQVFGALVVFAMRGEARARSELAVAHAELRATAAMLELTTREAERLRISRDLHDLAGHDLTALSLELEVATHLTAGSPGQPHVRRARSIAKDLLGTVRAAVGEMRAETPALEPALRTLAADIPGLDVAIEVDLTIAPGTDRVIVILRTVQEAITNIARHSGADRARIVVREDACDIVVTISDNGTGAERIVPGHGLTGMRERFESLGGSLDVTSRAGHGVTVTGRLPQRAAAGRPQ